MGLASALPKNHNVSNNYSLGMMTLFNNDDYLDYLYESDGNRSPKAEKEKTFHFEEVVSTVAGS